MYEELSSACSAPHTQYKSQTKLTRKVVTTQRKPHTIQRTSLAWIHAIDISSDIV